MKKLMFLFLILSSPFVTLKAQTYYSRQAGNWTDNASVWSTVSQTGAACSCNPGNSLASSTVVYIYNNISSFGALSSLSGSSKIIVEPGDSAIITTSTLSMSGSANITVNSGGVLIINGALNMVGSTNITNNGVMVVYGNISNSGSAIVSDNGDLTVHGNVSTSGSASFTGTGTSYVVGKVSGSGTSMLSVLPGFFSSFGSATGTGLIQYQSSPILSFSPLQFNGNANSVLTGNGTFANFSAISPWVKSGGNIYYNGGNVGIGTSGPLLYPLVVQGTALVNGDLFAQNLNAANGISIGSFRIINGIVDSFISTATQMQVVTNNLSANNAITAGTAVTAGTTMIAGGTAPSAIKIDGTNGTISSPSGTIGFGNNNITTTGILNSSSLNITGTSVIMKGIVTDSSTDLLQIDRNGNLGPVTGSSLQRMLYSSKYPCDPVCNGESAQWFASTSTNTSVAAVLSTDGCEWVGVGTQAPDAPLTVTPNLNSLPLNYAFTIQSPPNPCPGGGGGGGGGGNGNNSNTHLTPNTLIGGPDVFTVDIAGNTYMNGTLSVNGVDVGNIGISSTFNNKNNQVIITEGLNAGYDFNPLTVQGDQGIFWSDRSGGFNNSSGFVIAPHNNGSVPQGIRIDANGKVSIGVLASNLGSNITGNYNLYVANGILTEQVKVALQTSGDWSDYVFTDKYKLKPISEVDQFIKKNKHLPEVPSADDVKKDGINLGEMDATLLKKIEELTLYIIQQEKHATQQDEEIKELKAEIEKLDKNRK